MDTYLCSSVVAGTSGVMVLASEGFCPGCGRPLSEHDKLIPQLDLPNPNSRHILARLDQEIIALDADIGMLKEQAEQIARRAGSIGTRLNYVKAIRAELWPILDPSAPAEFPYDKRG